MNSGNNNGIPRSKIEAHLLVGLPCFPKTPHGSFSLRSLYINSIYTTLRLLNKRAHALAIDEKFISSYKNVVVNDYLRAIRGSVKSNASPLILTTQPIGIDESPLKAFLKYNFRLIFGSFIDIFTLISFIKRSISNNAFGNFWNKVASYAPATFFRERIEGRLLLEQVLVSHQNDIKLYFDGSKLPKVFAYMYGLPLADESPYSVNDTKVLEFNVERITKAQTYFSIFKSITEDTVNMKFVNYLDTRAIAEEVWLSPQFVALETRLYSIRQAVNEFLPSRPELVAELFKLILLDRDVCERDDSLEYESVVDSLKTIARSDGIYSDYLQPLLVEVLNNDSLGSAASKFFALDEMSRQKDREIVDILKRLYADESHPLHFEASLNLYAAVEDFPDDFPERQFDEIKEAARDKSFILS